MNVGNIIIFTVFFCFDVEKIILIGFEVSFRKKISKELEFVTQVIIDVKKVFPKLHMIVL